jgi:hypothetical protein
MLKRVEVSDLNCHQSVFISCHENLVMDYFKYENFGRGVNFRVLFVSFITLVCVPLVSFLNVSELYEKW